MNYAATDPQRVVDNTTRARGASGVSFHYKEPASQPAAGTTLHEDALANITLRPWE